MRLFDDSGYWVQVRDGDPRAFNLFKKHYTYKPRKPNKLTNKMKNATRFSGPGERIILMGKDGKSLLVWRKEKFRKDDQVGVANSVFYRSVGAMIIASEMLLQAEQIAWTKWPSERLFTFVNTKAVKSLNPGYCYKMAGWSLCGVSKARGHLILEKNPRI